MISKNENTDDTVVLKKNGYIYIHVHISTMKAL